MKTIKAFYKDKKGYYCQPGKEKFYYEVGVEYSMPEEDIEMCRRGFHASANFDISDTVSYYPVCNNPHYGIVEIEPVIVSGNKSVGDKIKVLEFIKDVNECIQYDKSGEWICYAGEYWRGFDYKKGLEALKKVDKTGERIYYSGKYWQVFDYSKGLEAIIKADKTGEGIYKAGKHWQGFDYKKGFEALTKVNNAGEWIYKAGEYWREFDYKKGLEALIKVDKTGEWIELARKY